MNGLVTDSPEDNLETCMNYAFVKNAEVWLRCADDGKEISLAGYISEQAKRQHGCDVTEEDVLNGDTCLYDCDCTIAVLNAVAIQSAELRERLRKYEDAEADGRLIVLPCKVGDTVWEHDSPGRLYSHVVIYAYIVDKKLVFDTDNGVSFDATAIGESIFLSRNEAEAAVERMNGNA